VTISFAPLPEHPAELGFNPLLGDLVADYEQALRAEGRSPRTIEWYLMFLREFVRFAARTHSTPRLSELSAALARRWLVAKRSEPRPPAPASLAGRARALRAFGSWVQSEFDLARHPLHGFRTPRVPRTLIPSLRDADMRALLAASSQGQFAERDTAVLLVLLDSGMRLSELVGLRVGCVDFETGSCRVMGKGAKERHVPLGRSARRVLRRMLLRRENLRATDPLFVAERGGALTASGVQKIVRRSARRAGLEVRCSPHVLRHTFARSFLANGGDVFTLQRILGHSPASLEVTQRYVALLDEDIREMHRRASPMDRLRER
jgi:site-specific recombinase XerD